MQASNQYTSGYKNILDVMSREMDNIVLLNSQPANQTFQVWAFSINQVMRRVERIDNLPALGDGEALDLGYFGENGHSADPNVADPGDDLLRIEAEETETIEELGIGVGPDNVYVGVESPPGAPLLGVRGDRARGFDSDDFPTRGAIPSQYTRTNDNIPTTALAATDEQGIIRVDSSENGRNRTYVGFYNDSGGQVTPSVDVFGASYKVTNIADRETIRDILFGNGYKRRVLTWGGLDNTSPNIPAGWEGVQVNSEDVRAAMTGR